MTGVADTSIKFMNCVADTGIAVNLSLVWLTLVSTTLVIKNRRQLELVSLFKYIKGQTLLLIHVSRPKLLKMIWEKKSITSIFPFWPLETLTPVINFLTWISLQMLMKIQKSLHHIIRMKWDANFWRKNLMSTILCLCI